MRAAYPICGLVLVLLAFVVVACQHRPRSSRPQPIAQAEGWLGTSFIIGGTEYELSLAGSNLVAAPRWVMEGSRNPRLLPGKAVFLARREVTKKFAAAASWIIDSIFMESYPETIPGGTNALSDRWYYQIEFQPAGWKAGDDHYRVWVLMDGSVILPEPKKAKDVESGRRED